MSVRRRTLLAELALAPVLVGTAGPAQAAKPTDRQVLLGYARDT